MEKQFIMREEDEIFLSQSVHHVTWFKWQECCNELVHKGESILNLAISRIIYLCSAMKSEKEMIKAKRKLLSRKTLTKKAEKMRILDYLDRVEKHEIRTHSASLADVLEIVLGKMYVDSGFEATLRFICDNLHYDIDLAEMGY